MKKLNLLLAAMLVFTVAAWAQGGGGGAGGGGAAGGGQGGAASSGGGHGQSAAGGQSASQGGTEATSGGTGAQVSGTHARHEIEGCVIQQGSDFYIQPTKGNKAMVRLVPENGQDLSAHVGHKVKVHGNSQMAAAIPNNPNAPAAGKDTNITNRDLASAAQGTNVPNSLTTPDQNPPAANAALAGSGALPQGSEVNVANAGTFTVDRIDMVSDTCNAKAMKHHDKDHDKDMDKNGANPPL